MRNTEADVGKLFTRNGHDAWRCISYCEYPTVSFQNLETGEERGGAIGSPIVQEFVELRQVKTLTGGRVCLCRPGFNECCDLCTGSTGGKDKS